MAEPGTVEDVAQAPDGPTVAAVFDLDGTLVDGFTAMVMAEHRFRNREVTADELVRMARLTVDQALGRSEYTAMLRATAQTWKGRLDDDIDELGQRLFVQKIAKRIVPHMRELVREHQRKNHTVVIASSATRYQVEPVARALGIDNVLCSQIEVTDGTITGEIVEPVLWGDGKSRAVQEFAAERGIDLSVSYAYADGDEDAALLHAVGNPRAVRPKSGLAKVAARRGWPVLTPKPPARVTRVHKARNLLGTATILPAAAGGLALGLLTRSKRRGVNFTMSNWFNAMFAVNGLQLTVVDEENLWAQRPAVFIANHVNNFDALIASKLVSRDYTGVGKAELRADPLTNLFGKLGGITFLERSDSAKAVAALRPVVDKIAEGYSVFISPEGTRSKDGELGPFKKGAFRLAMDAGVPIVPIVLRNALDIAARDDTVMRPGRVDVAVLPAVPVDEWTLDELPKRIEEVRQLYLDTLRDWPGPTSE